MAEEIVIVPAYFRPEFLYLCLEHIYAADESKRRLVHIFHDVKVGDFPRFNHDLEEIDVVAKYWRRHFGPRLRMFIRPEHSEYGNSRNVLEAYVSAYKTEAKYVYLIEDDVLITPDFFEWHESAQQVYKPFCSIAGSCDRNPQSSVDFESSEYASLGVCWRRENLEPVIHHAKMEYYRDFSPYVLEHFPGSKHGLWAMEQDGLIQRVMEQRFQKAVFASPPRAFHIGVFGYHRGIGTENMAQGSLSERIEFYRKATSDPEWIRKVAGTQSDIQIYKEACAQSRVTL